MPKLAVFKFASCDGCQLSLLDCEDELLLLAEHVTIAYFPEATRGVIDGPYDLTLVEGSVTTAHDAERIKEVRANSRFLVSIGACATAGGIQALRNTADVEEWRRIVYARPEWVETLAESTPIADHVPVDAALYGCPIDRHQLLEFLSAFLNARRPNLTSDPVCMECKARGTPCVLVSGTACLGPVTRGGCRALCPSYGRGCFGCYGPVDSPNLAALVEKLEEVDPEFDVNRALRAFTAGAPALRDFVAERQAHSDD